MNVTKEIEMYKFLGLETGRLPAALFIVSAIAFGLPGNCLSLYILLFRMDRQSTYVIFVSFLAMFDVLTCAVHMPLELIDLVFPFSIPEWLCKCFRFNNSLLYMGSLATLLVIAVVRYRHIVHPLKQKLSHAKARQCCWAVFVLSILTAAPAFVLNGNHTATIGNSTATICYIADTAQKTIYPTVYLTFYGMFYCLSVVILCLTYVVIVKTIRKANIARRQMQRHVSTCLNTISQPLSTAINPKLEKMFSDTDTNQPKLNEKSIGGSGKSSKNGKTKVLLLITIIFILAYLPYVSIGVVLTLQRNFKSSLSTTQEAIYRVAIRFPLINHVANPVIYGFCDPNFKKHLKALFLNSK
ncbi:neuropeptide S receptor-like [Saccostrea echinata]|uniref:neuropeptide S receptor-like n=1 Tax=Saccostrea echinata TaxID=191078 RepID=UPI002A83F533|nr:neuropeptide S receptor-like [Saccostrea echinata]